MATTADKVCPKCKGPMWDNRVGKRNPKSPDFKCKNTGCGEAIWLDEKQEKAGTAAAPTPAATAPAPTSTAIATRNTEIVSGTFRDAKKATEALMQASKIAHLVAPSPVCATLPDGCEVAMAAVVVDAAMETYPITGKADEPKDDDTLGLGKVALDKISAAIGVTWDPDRSRRLDDGSDPYYCHYQAVGRVRNFDGSWRTIKGEKEVDMRPGSPQVEAIQQREEKKKADFEAKKWTYKGDLGKSQVREMRLHILGHAETKARLRAIRSLGIRTSYKRAELAKPFVCARTTFTGQSDDPTAQQYYRRRIADSFLDASSSMYGESSTPAPQQPVLPAPSGHRPPAVGTVHDPDDDGFTIETTATEAPSAGAAPAQQPASSTDVFAPLRGRVADILNTPAGGAVFTKLFGDTVLPEELTGKQMGELLDAVDTAGKAEKPGSEAEQTGAPY